MQTKKKIIKIALIIILTMLVISNNIFATVGVEGSNSILSMPIIKIIIVIVACLIVTTLLYSVSNAEDTNIKELKKHVEKNKYNNEYNKKKKDTAIDKKIIAKANEPAKPRVREEYIRESKLDQELLEEITDLYKKENEVTESNEIVEEEKIIKNNTKIKKEKEEKKEVKKESQKKNVNDNLAEDFLNNLEMTMKEGK